MENLFQSLSHPDSIMFLISVLFCFLLGFLTGWALWGSRAKRYKKEAAKWKKSYDDLTLDYKTQRELLDLKEADLVRAQREAEEAKDQLSAFYQDKAKWQADLDTAMGETVKLQASNSSYQATIEDLNNQLLGLKARNAQLTKAAEKEGTALDQVSQMQSSFNATLNRIGSLEGKISQLIAENESLRAANTSEDQQLTAMQKSHAESAQRIAALEAKMNALVEENDSLHAELAGLKHSENVYESAPPAEPKPVIQKDKDVITMIVTPSSAKDDVLGAIGTKIPAATADEKDDLTMIKGIGSFLEKKLNSLGIYTFDQVSKFDHDFSEKITEAIEFFPGRIERDDWAGQATRLATIKREDPEALTTKAVFPNNEENLKIVEGIGPKIEKLLNDAGIKTWEQLAAASVDSLREILQNAGDRYRMHDPATWPEQAKLAASGDFEKLKTYQDYLSGGREPDQED